MTTGGEASTGAGDAVQDAPPHGGASPDGRRVALDWRAVAVLVGAGVAALLVQNVVQAAHRPLGWAVACAVVALLLEPIVARLDDVVPRAAALALTLLVVAAAAGGLVWGVLGDLSSEAARLQQEAPAAAARIEARDDAVGDAARELGFAERVEGFADALGDRFGPTDSQVTGAVGTLPTYLVCTVLTIFLLAARRKLVDGAVGQLRDAERRRRIGLVVDTAIRRAQGYLASALLEGVVVGLVVAGVAVALGLPAPVVLGLLGAVLALIPGLGIVLAGIVPALLAAGTVSLTPAVAVLVGAVAAQGLEARLVRRRLDRATLHVGPAVPVVVALVGFELYGIGGALYAAAVAVVALAVADAAATPDTDGDPSTDPAEGATA